MCVSPWVVSALVRLHPHCSGPESKSVHNWIAATWVSTWVPLKCIQRESKHMSQAQSYQFFELFWSVQWRGGSDLLVEAHSKVWLFTQQAKVSGAEFWISTLLQLVEETNCALIHGEPFQVFTILNTISVTNNVANDCHYDIWFLQAWVLLASNSSGWDPWPPC